MSRRNGDSVSDLPAPVRQQAHASLAVRFVAVVLAATFMTALVVSWLAVESTRTFLERRIAQTYPALLGRSADRLVAWIEEGRRSLGVLATEPKLRSAIARPAGESGAWQELAEALAASRFFESLVVQDAEGETLFHAGSSDQLPEGAPELPDAEPRLWAAPETSRDALLVASVPLGGAGRGATLHGIYRIASIEALLDAEGIGTFAELCFVDAQGRIRSALCERRVAGGSSVPVSLPLAELASGDVRQYDTPSGERVVGAARPLGMLGWYLLLEEAYEEAYQPVYAVVKRVVVADVLILLLFGLVAWKVTNAIVRPISALSDWARRVAGGELDAQRPDVRSRDEIGLLTQTFSDMTRKLLSHRKEMESVNTKLVAQNEELQRANEVLEQLSITDGLTKLHNHRFFQDHLTREIKRVNRTREPLSMLVIDIDDFKQLNDRQGHKAGDEMLLGLARILNESIRENDFVARYGGEEFVVLTPATELEGAIALAEKIRLAVCDASFILGDSKQITKTTISIGVALFRGNRRAFFQAADSALYRAKAAGKKCVVAVEEPS